MDPCLNFIKEKSFATFQNQVAKHFHLMTPVQDPKIIFHVVQLQLDRKLWGTTLNLVEGYRAE